FQAEDGIRVFHVTGVQTCALPIYLPSAARSENASCWAATRSQVAIRSSTLPVPAHVLQTSRRIFVGWTLLTYSTPPYFFTLATSVSMVRFPAQVGQMVIYAALSVVASRLMATAADTVSTARLMTASAAAFMSALARSISVSSTAGRYMILSVSAVPATRDASSAAR